jgi:hypothetical protein
LRSAKEAIYLYFDPLRRFAARLGEWVFGRFQPTEPALLLLQRAQLQEEELELVLKRMQELGGDRERALELQYSAEERIIRHLEEQRSELAIQYLRRAEHFRVDPMDHPHVVHELQRWSRFCRGTGLLISLLGVGVAAFLTAGVLPHFLGSLAGVLGFATAVIVCDGVIDALRGLSLAAISPRWIWWPLALAAFAAVCLCAARLPPTRDFFAPHPKLIALDLLLLELGLVWSAAACFATARYFGWSVRITSRYEAAEAELDRLRRQVEEHRRSREARDREPTKQHGPAVV